MDHTYRQAICTLLTHNWDTWITFSQTQILQNTTRNMKVHMFYVYRFAKIKDGKTFNVPSNVRKFGGLERQSHPNKPKCIIW
jgi:hypothetical protein